MKRYAAVSLFAIALAACEGDTPTEFVDDVQFNKGQAKVTLCHTTGNGSYHAIEVATAAQPAHMAHGDGVPGASLPDNSGSFSSTCAITRLVLDHSTTYMAFQAGGGGGDAFNDPCPSGSVAVGVTGNAGDYFGWSALWNHSVTCRELRGDGSLGATTSTPPRGPLFGITTGAYAGTCAGGVMTGYEGWQAWNVNSLIGQCAPVSTIVAGGSFTSQIGPFYYPWGAGWWSSYFVPCNPGYVVTGTFGRSGDILDAVGFACTKIVVQA